MLCNPPYLFSNPPYGLRLNVDSQVASGGGRSSSLCSQQLGAWGGFGKQHHVGASRLEQLEQVVHGGVSPELGDGAHAEGRHRDVGKHVNQDQLLHQEKANDCLPVVSDKAAVRYLFQATLTWG